MAIVTRYEELLARRKPRGCGGIDPDAAPPAFFEVVLPARHAGPPVIRPRRRAFVTRSGAAASARARRAAGARRQSNRWLLRAAGWGSAAFLPLLLCGYGDVPHLLLGGSADAAARAWIVGGFTTIVLVAALAGILASRREDAALTHLQRAAADLSPREASRVIRRLRREGGDDAREAVFVLRHVTASEPAELSPAAADRHAGSELAAARDPGSCPA